MVGCYHRYDSVECACIATSTSISTQSHPVSSKLPLRLFLPSFLAISCTGEQPEESASEATGSTGSAGVTGPSEASSTSTDSDPTGTTTSSETTPSATSFGSSTGDPPDDEPVLAGGIAVDAVEINQGVGITLAQAGEVIATQERNAPVISGRPALVRSSYLLHNDYSPRLINAQLHLSTADIEIIYTDSKMIIKPANWQELGGAFEWFVDAEDLNADTEFRVEFLEAPGVEEPVGSVDSATLPAQGFAELGAWPGPMVLDIMLVPFTCDGIDDLDLSPENIADLEAYLYNTYPVQELNLSIRAPVASAECNEFDAAEIDLPALREADGAAPWVYYGGLMPGDGGGYSISIEGGDSMDYRRTFASHTWRQAGLSFDLYAHELGHNHGQVHTFEDPEYPNTNSDECGAIQTYGWGPRSALMPSSGWGNDVDLGLVWFDPHDTLLMPTQDPCIGAADGNRWNFNDFMSYQYPYWVSAYTYSSAAERIKLISPWSEDAGKPAPEREQTLRLIISPEGEIRRQSYAGGWAIKPEQADAWAKCRTTDGEVRLPVRRRPGLLERTDDDGHMRSFVYEAFELPLQSNVHARSCILEAGTIGLMLPFVAD